MLLLHPPQDLDDRLAPNTNPGVQSRQPGIVTRTPIASTIAFAMCASDVPREDELDIATRGRIDERCFLFPPEPNGGRVAMVFVSHSM